MKRKTLGQLVKSEKGNLHVLLPLEIMELLQKDADEHEGGNKSRSTIRILALFFDLLAHS